VKKNIGFEKDIDDLDTRRAKAEAYTALIIKEQEGILKTAEKGKKRADAEIVALRRRLQDYVGPRARPMDDRGDDLKHRYLMQLRSRDSFEKAVIMAEESITAAKLHMIDDGIIQCDFVGGGGSGPRWDVGGGGGEHYPPIDRDCPRHAVPCTFGEDPVHHPAISRVGLATPKCRTSGTGGKRIDGEKQCLS